jgi:hypothetical protein
MAQHSRLWLTSTRADSAADEQTPFELEFGPEAIAAAVAEAERREKDQWLALLRLLEADGRSDLHLPNASTRLRTAVASVRRARTASDAFKLAATVSGVWVHAERWVVIDFRWQACIWVVTLISQVVTLETHPSHQTKNRRNAPVGRNSVCEFTPEIRKPL